jgi:hypothetical protein
MGDFAIIAEGITDQVVLKNVLLGCLADQDEEPLINFEQPRLDESARGGEHAPGGWTLVLRYFKDGLYKAALQTNAYLVVHIDTDVSDDYGVPKGAVGDEQTLIDRVVARFKELIDPAIWQAHRDRFIFAIAVHEIECWLLPPLYVDQKAKQAKITGCFAAADSQLAALKRPGLRNKEGRKDPGGYNLASAPYRKRKFLLAHHADNISLKVFVDEVARRSIIVPVQSSSAAATGSPE